MAYAGAKSILANSSYIAATRVVLSTLRTIYFVLLARELTSGDFAGFQYAIKWQLALMPLTDWGIGVILGREIGRGHEAKEKLLDQTFTIKVGLTALVAAGAAVVGWLTEADPLYRWLLIIFSATILARGTVTWCTDVFRAHEATRYQFWTTSAFRLLEVTVGSALLFAGASVLVLAWVHALSWVAQAGVSLAVTAWRFHRLRPSFDWGEARSILSWGVPIAVTFALLEWGWHGPLILARHTVEDSVLLGAFALGLHIFSFGLSFPRGMSRAGLPVISRAHQRQDGKDATFVAATLRAGVLAGASGAIVADVVPPNWIGAVFGGEYSILHRYLPALMGLLVFATWNLTFFFTAMARREWVAPFISFAIGAVIMTSAVPLLHDSAGLNGIIAAMGSGMAVASATLIAQYRTRLELELVKTVVKPALAGGASLAVFYGLDFGSEPLRGLLALVVMGGVFLALGGISKAEWQTMLAFVKPSSRKRA